MLFGPTLIIFNTGRLQIMCGYEKNEIIGLEHRKLLVYLELLSSCNDIVKMLSLPHTHVILVAFEAVTP